jgi:hypothetical protein
LAEGDLGALVAAAEDARDRHPGPGNRENAEDFIDRIALQSPVSPLAFDLMERLATKLQLPDPQLAAKIAGTVLTLGSGSENAGAAFSVLIKLVDSQVLGLCPAQLGWADTRVFAARWAA